MSGILKRFNLSFSNPSGPAIKLEVSQAIYEIIDDLQRGHWRLERRESRHTLHLEMMSEASSAHLSHEKDPEQIYLEMNEATSLWEAVASLPTVQSKRLLLQVLEGLTISQIAQLEHCSERAVKYSLALARKNLRKKLSE